MNPDDNPTPKALVTGATSGLGFEAAIPLAETGYDPGVVTGRTAAKAESARASLAERTGLDVFAAVALDLDDAASIDAAVHQLVTETGSLARFDLLVLNAGRVSSSDVIKTADDIEITFASSLTGHHRLAMGLLEREAVAPDATIVISGSEAARGDVPTFNPVDLPKLAAGHYDGDLEAAARSLIRHDGPTGYNAATRYATTKLFVAWWAAAMARLWPAPMTVLAVSPGSAPETGASRYANFFMRRIMLPVLTRAPARFGLAAPVPVAAARYLEAATFGPETSGRFYASAPGKMIGPLHQVELDHVEHRPSQDAAWNATVAVTGVGPRIGQSDLGRLHTEPWS